MSGWWLFGPTRDLVTLWGGGKRRRSPAHRRDVDKIRVAWPELATALDALVAADENGPPPCSAQYPPPDFRGDRIELLDCHLPLFHDGAHVHHFADGSTIEWDLTETRWTGR